jgi:hypothetical protein
MTGFITGFIIGGISVTLYITWFFNKLKKGGWIIIEPTKKLKDELK